MTAAPTAAQGSLKVALIGDGIGPSLTPPMHEAEGRALGLDYTYERVDLAGQDDVDLAQVLAHLEARGFAAANVTHPYKQAVLAHVDELSDEVQRIGSANLVLLGPSRRAHNTDCTGFGSGLATFLQGRAAGRVLQVGAGGAGLATAYAMLGMGFDEIVVHDRDAASARRLVERFADVGGSTRLSAADGELADLVSQADGVVHVTPMGMAEHPGTAFAPEGMAPGAWLAEVVYRPLETELVRRARGAGLRVLDGGLMAVGQAADSMAHITHLAPDRDRMLAHFQQLITTD